MGGTAANGFGQATLTLDATAGANITVSIASTATSIFTRGNGGTLLIRGTNFGTAAPAAGITNIIGNATSLGQSTNGGQSVGQAGVLGTTNQLIYPWAVVDTSVTGVGIAFASYNGNTIGVQALQAGSFITAAPTLLTLNGTTLNASPTVTMTNTTGLAIGQLVTGTGIPAGDTIATINPGVSITLSANATATANNTLSFYSGASTTPTSRAARRRPPAVRPRRSN